MSAVTIDLGERGRTASLLLDALPHPVLLVDGEGQIEEANIAAENFFQASTTVLRRHPLAYFVPFGSPLLSLVEQVRKAEEARRDAMEAVPVDEGRIRSVMQQLGQAQTELAIMQARFHSDVYALLTPEQQEQAQKLRAEREARLKQRQDRLQQRLQPPGQALPGRRSGILQRHQRLGASIVPRHVRAPQRHSYSFFSLAV